MEAMDEIVRTLRTHPNGPGRVLLTGWFSFLDGEVTAGDLLARSAAAAALDAAGIAHHSAWSAGFAPGALSLDAARPAGYRHLLFVCGPLHGEQILRLHRRYADCVRLAVDVSVLDPHGPEATGFHRVVARDGDPASPPRPDLAALAPAGPTPPLVAVVLTGGQGEYAGRRRHEEVSDILTAWIGARDCARLPVDTRLAVDDWRLCATAEQFLSVVSRCDAVLTTRLHGLVLALRAGVPVLAVDPVGGGAKVTAQARALRWPAVLGAGEVSADALEGWWRWCLSAAGRTAAARRARLMDRARARAAGRVR
ncbi:polysaccharide pyruvyl transferase family protein [Streptomyces sp. NPDC007088]|uniref:polysaccharide pyruvyl transferase family protein n=1 Tax=Streptomyces sp. NPDC007088 TaxID=3364773 RepID=UPI00367FFF95